MNTWELSCPLHKQDVLKLRAGDKVVLTGTVLAARDEAHKRLFELAQRNEPWPVDVAGEVIYYVGPSPAFDGRAVGAAGPTTSGRMDKYTPMMHQRGVAATMGKGYRSEEVKQAMIAHQAVYLVATGGAGALLGQCIWKKEVVAYPDLGPEAIVRLWIRDFPAIVAYDTLGQDLYAQNQSQWAR
ncbi:FumA C-terminus/TtdB family hydratase beta subunit [Alicyclobacillus tolerans]|uniref:FumA C-terminus/TtdB family hydratase beta subunit n=1 Tax=Alicyclobacillus tolerans TaxID=90970 RepID=UPI001F010A54|nr:FumA C-terminus/TtdB family hydratase beta subunit [Alicyclobacillus tolerans]MCF8567122.1 FumA C-terminus/TtdB family hydratase beta subunit [Alicyclobacillus tolerans]